MAYTPSTIITAGSGPATGFSQIGTFGLSPDNTKVVLVTDTGIWELTIAGTVLTQLTPNFAAATSIQYSPDGTKILLSTAASFYEIWTMNADGTNQVRILLGTSRFGYYAANWRPDGLKILLSVTDNTLMDVGGQLYTCNPDGSSLTFLAGGSEALEDWQGVYSPNGTYIVFNKFQTTSSDGLYRMLADGTGQVALGLPISGTTGGALPPTIWRPDSLAYLIIDTVTIPLAIATADLDGSGFTDIYSDTQIIEAQYFSNLNIIMLGSDFMTLSLLTGSGFGPTTVAGMTIDCATKYVTITGTNFAVGATVELINPLGVILAYIEVGVHTTTQFIIDISSSYVDFGESKYCVSVINP